jgi:hypothetical protein
MRRVVLALPVVWLAAVPASAERRGMNGPFVTLEIFQPVAPAFVPLFGLRMGGVRGHFGLEGGASAGSFIFMKELSALGVVNPSGVPVLLRGGVSFIGRGAVPHVGAPLRARTR